MRETAIEFKHKQLFAGEVRDIIRLDVSAGEYKRGTLLSSEDGLVYAPATEVALNGHYAICGDDVTLEDAGEVVAYKHGYFNKSVVEVNGAEATADNVKILKTVDIFLVETIEQ